MYEIPACELCADARARALESLHVCSGHAGLCVVGAPDCINFRHGLAGMYIVFGCNLPLLVKYGTCDIVILRS